MPLSADDRIILVRVKVERAYKHLNDLESEIIKFRNEYLPVVLAENDPQTGQPKPGLRMVKLPILPWNSVAGAGDVIHNLRSALDHLAYQLVIVGSGREPSRRVEFPIAKDVATYEAEKARKVEGMRPIAIKHLDNLKPYKGGNEPLWRIHELDNIDKHRALFTVAHDYLFVADWMQSSAPYLLKASDPHFVGVFDTQVEQDVQLEIEEAVRKPQPVYGNALLPSLHQLVDFVRELVSAFKPLLE